MYKRKKMWDFKKIKNHKKSRFKKNIYIWEELECFKLEIVSKKADMKNKRARFNIYIYIYMRRTRVFQTWDPPEKKLISKKKWDLKIYIYEKNLRSSGKKLISPKKKKKWDFKINIWEEIECLKLEILKEELECKGW